MSQSNKPIQIFVPKFRISEILDEIKICLEKGWTGMGFKTLEFEKQWSKFTNLPNSHYLSSNTVGLHLALNIFKKEDGWEDGDEVVTTPLTFVSTNHSILYENLKPVFADVDDSLCLDPDSVLKNISDRTRAVIFVGIGGNLGRLKEISKICKKHNLRLILDAAHMAGSYTKNSNSEIVHVGKEADVSVFSFQAVKNLPTADSGMICFKNKKLDSKCRQLSWLGINKDTFARTGKQGEYKWKYDVPDLGFKYHGNSIMASIGIVQLKYLAEDNQRRRELCKIYEQNLNDTKSLSIISSSPDTAISSRHLFQIIVSDSNSSNLRDILLEYLNSKNIFPGVHYRINTKYPMYSRAKGNHPNATRMSNSILSLPLHLNMEDEDAIRVSNTIKEYLL